MYKESWKLESSENLEVVAAQFEEFFQAQMQEHFVGNKTISASCKYSLFAGGKRVRPLLCLAAAKMNGFQNPRAAYICACALEMIHTYSLIHDDLPAMDDDNLRRGKPTNHKVFGEAIAILAGDALLTEAITFLVKNTKEILQSSTILNIIEVLMSASGVEGMIEGQVKDLEGEEVQLSLKELETIHSLKTAKLIAVALHVGVLSQEVQILDINALREFGAKLGLAFQVKDDILDIESTSAILGKTAGKDVKQNKSTYPKLLGTKNANDYFQNLINESELILKTFNNSSLLTEIFTLLKNRSH